MGEFDSFFLLDTETVKCYAVEVLHLFEPDEKIATEEIGDGNINYVFRVWSVKDGHSVIVKQADRLLRSSGRLLDQNRSRIEAAALRLEGELAPSYVPKVYYYDKVMAAIAMEDVSSFGNLRRVLADNHVYPHLSENLSAFMVDTLLPTTDLVLDAEEKKRRAQFFTNPELCKITEDLVLTEPYYNYKKRNIITPENEEFVKQNLYGDKMLHAEVAALRLNFMNNAQALLHGDLHTGSVFANETGIKVLDPEFAFYGPMGYDIGNVIGNLFFSWANKAFAHQDEEEAAAAVSALKTCIAEVYDKTRERLEKRYNEWVTLPLYHVPAFREQWISSVMSDAAGYAGTEIIRRTVGDSKVMEITTVTDYGQRIPMERALVNFGVELIKNRTGFRKGREMTELFERML